MYRFLIRQPLTNVLWHKALLLNVFRLVLVLNCFPVFSQTTYYVANTGNDQNAGTAPGTPFQSLTKVNQLALQPGDVVRFRRGDTFRGTLLVRQSGAAGRPIVYEAYDSGSSPTLAASVLLTNWTNIGGNVWQAACQTCGSSVTGVYRDETALPLGRYPNLNASNRGYLTIASHNGQNQIVSQENLPGGINWRGGEAVMRPTQWIIDRATITQQSGNTLNLANYANNSTYTPGDGWGYFIQNHPATLDQNGEWYYDAANKLIRLYSDQANPNSQRIAATVQSRGVDATGVSYVILRNLHITQALNETLSATNVSSFTVTNSEISNSGEDGVVIKGSGSNLVLEANTIVEVNNNGVRIDPYQNVTFRGNSLRRVGVWPGRGKGGDGQYNGFQSTANANVLIEQNRIDSVGYNGLTFGNNTLIQQNVISNYCMTKSDGGAIYAWNGLKAAMTNIRIVSNIIYNGVGAPEGSYRREYSGANGIFMDDCVENVEIRNNTVFNNIQWGVFLHAVSNITFVDNTSFDNGVSQFSVYPNGNVCLLRNNVFKRNIFMSKLPTQGTAQYESYTDDLPQFGTIDSNYYARPFDEGATILGVINANQGSLYTLADWTRFSKGFDSHSKVSPLTYKQFKNEGGGGTSRISSTFDTDLDGWYIIYSNYNNGEAVLDQTNKLDGNSLRISFTNPAGRKDAYTQAIRRFGTLIKGKTYVLRFDAVASVNVDILVYLRSYGPPYTNYDRRYTVSLSPSRTSYELPFVASADGVDPVAMFQIDGEGPTFWLDNIRLQEDVPIRNNPDEFIRLFYNPTLKDSVVTLTGAYRDVNNKPYRQSVTLRPFSSIVLLRDTLPVAYADLSLSLQTARRVLQVNEPTELRLEVRNQSATPAALARWTYRLPANLDIVQDDGQVYGDRVLTGTVSQLAPMADTVFTFRVRPTSMGLFRTAAQLTTATSPDPDSRPNSGTADGEDDAATVEFRVDGPAMPVYESPNPNQRSLPTVVSSQPPANPDQADLSIRLIADQLTASLGQPITYTLYVTNDGGRAADAVQVENQLPDGVELVEAAGWAGNGRLLTTTLGTVAAGTTRTVSFQVRLTTPGDWINRAQISASNTPDPDSTPGNGYMNGEDDQVEIRVRSR
ncbi:right-handed parallel beta-helix repeat-containing protein [Spirosoma koreense]